MSETNNPSGGSDEREHPAAEGRTPAESGTPDGVGDSPDTDGRTSEAVGDTGDGRGERAVAAGADANQESGGAASATAGSVTAEAQSPHDSVADADAGVRPGGDGDPDTGPIDQSQTVASRAYAHSRRPRTVPMGRTENDDFAPLDDPLYQSSSLGGVVNSPVSKSSPARRLRGRTIALIALIVVLLLVIAGASVELWARSKASDAASCVEKSLGEITGAPVHVELSRGPYLFSVFSGTLAWADVDTQDGQQTSAIQLHARADDVHTDGSTIGSLDGNAYIPLERAMELANQQSGTKISSLTADSKAGTITATTQTEMNLILLSVTVDVTVEMKPVAANGKVQFEVVKASANKHFDVPNGLAQSVVDSMTQSMLGPLLSQVTLSKLVVRDAPVSAAKGADQPGIEVSFTGSDVNLAEASAGLGGSTNCT